MKRLITVLSFLILPSVLSAQWKIVKKMLNPGVKILVDSKDILEVQLPGSNLKMRLSQNSDDSSADIVIRYEQKLSSNPYKVYYVTDRLKQDKSKPKSVWIKFFKTRFLSILRNK